MEHDERGRAVTAPSVGVLVRVDRSLPSEALVQRLTAAGMQVERVLRRVGVVSGTVPSAQLEGLGGVAGVTAVEREREVRSA